MKNVLTLLSCLFFCTTIVTATTHDTVYAVTQNDGAFLRYYAVTNEFDSCVVLYRFGEVRMRMAGSYTRVYLDTLLKTDASAMNGTPVGVQSDIVDLLKTKVFYIGSGCDSITFYRSITMTNFSGQAEKTTSKWQIDDSSDFVVQLVRASDDHVLASLDSIGIAKNSYMSSDPEVYYGTSPNDVNPTYFIPMPARSCSAYVRIVPIRRGPSPYGMGAVGIREPFSLGPQSSHTNGHLNPVFFDYAEGERFSRLISFYDTYFANNCCLPISRPTLPNWQTDSISRRYFDTLPSADPGSYTILDYKPCQAKMGMTRRPLTTTLSVRYGNDVIDMQGTSMMDVSGDWQVYNSVGYLVASKEARFSKGAFTDRIYIDVPAGVYFVGLRDRLTNSWAFEKFMVR